MAPSKVPAIDAVVRVLWREASRRSFDMQTAGCALRGMQWLMLSPVRELIGADALASMRAAADAVLSAAGGHQASGASADAASGSKAVG